MSQPRPASDPRAAAPAPRRRRPASLVFEPPEAVADPEHFFDLESMEDPRELLRRSTELALAFQVAADRATEYQAMAAAQLTDPQRFDRMPLAVLAEQAEWSQDYARKMIEFGRGLLQNGGAHLHDAD